MKFSIIIPVYNIVDYLKQCVDSVLNQTYKNYELILVDDGSTDGSSALCDEYSANNKNISVIHQKNQGLSAARNNGIKYANGDYILFLDSDDYWISDNILYKINEIINSDEIDIIMFDARIEQGTLIQDLNLTNKLNSKYKDGIAFLSDALSLNPHYRWYAWIYAYRKKFWLENKFSYPVGMKYEDIPTTYRILLKASGVRVIHDTVYNYLKSRGGSITTEADYDAIVHRLAHIKNIEKNLVTDDKIPNSVKIKLLQNISFTFYELLILVNQVRDHKMKDFAIKKLKDSKSLMYYAKDNSNKYKVIYGLSKLFGISASIKLLNLRMKIKS